MAKSRPMGYIFPKRIQNAIAGETPTKIFYNPGLTEEQQIDKDEMAIEKAEKAKVLEEARSPWMCPTCDKMMRNKLDQKYYNRRGMCMECTIKAETYLKGIGLFKKYEEAITLRNYKAFMLDVKAEAEEFLVNLKDEIKIVNHDGTFDTLKSDTKEVKEFIIKEIEDMDNKLKEVEDIDMSVSAEESIGVNIKGIIKEIIQKEKQREEFVEKNS